MHRFQDGVGDEGRFEDLVFHLCLCRALQKLAFRYRGPLLEIFLAIICS